MSSRILKLASAAFLGIAISTASALGLADGAAKFVGATTFEGDNLFDFGTYWNQITVDSDCMWGKVEQTRGNFDFSECDKAYNWAKQNGAHFKFHSLVYGGNTPNWLNELDTAETLKAITTWFDAVAEHYSDLEMIDVIDEVVRFNSTGYTNYSSFTNTKTKIIPALGGDNDGDYKFVTTAFKMARERWPKAILIYNDYNTFQWQREEWLDLAITIKKNGAPIDGLGMDGDDLILRSGRMGGTTDVSCLDSNKVDSLIRNTYDKTGLALYISRYSISTMNDIDQQKCYANHFPVFMKNEYIAGVTLWNYIYDENITIYKYSGIIKDGKDRKAMTWLKEYFAEHKAESKNKWGNYTVISDTTVKDSTKNNPPTAIASSLHLQTNTLQSYDVFDVNGVRLGRLRAYTMDEAISILQNTSEIKVQGIYMLRSVKNGTVKQVRIARAK